MIVRSLVSIIFAPHAVFTGYRYAVCNFHTGRGTPSRGGLFILLHHTISVLIDCAQAVEVQEVADNVDEGVDGEVRFPPRSSSCAISLQGVIHDPCVPTPTRVIIQYLVPE